MWHYFSRPGTLPASASSHDALARMDNHLGQHCGCIDVDIDGYDYPETRLAPARNEKDRRREILLELHQHRNHAYRILWNPVHIFRLLFSQFCCGGTNYGTAAILVDPPRSIQVISPLLIIYRVASGRAWTRHAIPSLESLPAFASPDSGAISGSTLRPAASTTALDFHEEADTQDRPKPRETQPGPLTEKLNKLVVIQHEPFDPGEVFSACRHDSEVGEDSCECPTELSSNAQIGH